MNIIDSFTARKLPDRTLSVQAVVIHTTGDTDLTKILHYYQAVDGLQPHYVIALDGTIHRIVPESVVAYHCKLDPTEANLYRHGYPYWSHWIWCNGLPVDRGEEQSNYRTWRDTWNTQSIDSPLDLVTGAHPNLRSIGIELQQPTDNLLTKDVYSDAQYAALSDIVYDVVSRHGIELNRRHILGHYDCSPMRRSTASGGWDPGERFNFNRLFETVPKPIVAQLPIVR